MRTVYWLQCGVCGGDTMSFLAMESPDMVELFREQNLEMLWHPSLSAGTASEHDKIIDDLRSGRQSLDILLVEGFVSTGPDGTGLYDTYKGEPKPTLVRDLAQQAAVIIAVGTCASFGGIGNS